MPDIGYFSSLIWLKTRASEKLDPRPHPVVTMSAATNVQCYICWEESRTPFDDCPRPSRTQVFPPPRSWTL